MIPTLIVPLAVEILRLVNNLIEGTPLEQRRANAIIWFQTTWPLVKGLLPKETQLAVEALMADVKP